ncbi:MAG: hypothetical protein ACE5OZ_24140 [Candidatus Heimdallarchaeota archaeon]
MTSTIKMDDEIKRRFDQLQARILIETGKKLNQQELLELLLKEAELKGEKLFQEISQLRLPLSEGQKQKFSRLQADFGFDTSKVNEDSVIYRD